MLGGRQPSANSTVQRRACRHHRCSSRRRRRGEGGSGRQSQLAMKGRPYQGGQERRPTIAIEQLLQGPNGVAEQLPTEAHATGVKAPPIARAHQGPPRPRDAPTRSEWSPPRPGHDHERSTRLVTTGRTIASSRAQPDIPTVTPPFIQAEQPLSRCPRAVRSGQQRSPTAHRGATPYAGQRASSGAVGRFPSSRCGFGPCQSLCRGGSGWLPAVTWARAILDPRDPLGLFEGVAGRPS